MTRHTTHSLGNLSILLDLFAKLNIYPPAVLAIGDHRYDAIYLGYDADKHTAVIDGVHFVAPQDFPSGKS